MGLSASESRSIVTDAILTAQKLIRECQALRQESTQLLQGAAAKRIHSDFLLAELELGLTLCESACTYSPPPVQLERLLRSAHLALSSAKSAIARLDFSAQDKSKIADGIERPQIALEAWALKESSPYQA